MKQTKWQRLATIGLCSSLVINAFSGVTAVAETITIESSPTVASSVKEETTKASTETSEATTETSRKVMKEQETEESVKQEVVKEKEEPKEKVEQDIVAPSINKISPRATVIFPESIFQIGFVDEKGALVAPENVSIKYDYINWEQNVYSNRFTSSIITPNVEVPNVNGLKQIVLPAANIAQTNYPGPNGAGTQNAYRGTAPANFSISIPKYYENLSLYDQSGNISPAYPLPIVKQRNKSGTFALDLNTMKFYLNVKKKDDGTYTNTIENNFKTTTLRWPIIMERRVDSVAMGTHYSYYSEGPVYYHLTNRKVTESFKDTAGATIPAPTGFTQGKQTSITSNNYTFKQAGTLPETYKASNGKTYKFKGWYKGKTKPNTLTTTKAPSYAVTYDDNDDLNVVYEEVNFPETTYQFGFVNEAGQLVNPEDINLTYDYKSIVFRGTGGADSTVSFGTIANNQSGVKVGNLRQVTLPAKNIAQPTATGWNGEAFANFSIKLPKYYKSLNLYDKTGKIDPKYPLPVKATVSSASSNAVQSEASVIADLTLTQRADGSFTPRETYSVIDPSVRYPGFLRRVVSYSSSGSTTATHQTISGPVYYHLTNRKVTESFKDTAGATIPAPTGFTQGKQTSITSNNYTFKQAGTLPETYKASNGKTYKFKGWYKGKTKPNTLTTTKAPSYPVAYNDDDDLTVVYEEIEFFDFPALTYQFGFVDESGKRVDASTIDLTYDNWHGELLSSVDGWKTTNIEKGQVALTKNNLKEIVYPSHSLEIMNGRSSQYSAANLTFKIPKYYENISVYNKNGTFDTAYPFPTIKVNTSTTPLSNRPQLFQLKKSNNQSFIFNQTTTAAPADVQVPYNLREIVYDPAASVDKGLYHMLDKPIYYYLTNRKVTENFVDANGTKITPPTGFTQGNQIPMTSNTFKYTSARALPASYSVGGKTYIFQGWYKGKTKPNTLTTSTTPTYNTTFDGNDDMTAVYKEANISANLTMRGAVDVIDNGAAMEYWEVLLKNTGEAPLTSVKIKPTTDWAAGISTPTELFILGTGQNTKVRPITKEQWEAGFEIPLDSSLPVGGQLTINLLGTKVTGQPNQVLKAAVEVTGNFNKLTASDTVRIKDLDQETKEPTGEGFISVPTFNFGQVGVAGSTQQHGLKKAADYYGNGTRNPYLRIKKTQPNWSLTAQLSQPKSATDSLPTTTRLLLGTAAAAGFTDYNQPTETKTPLGKTGTVNLTADNTATAVVANQQFTGSDVYQLDFTFANIKLEVPANQGMVGQQYQAAVTWNLVTGP
ncbi:WxL domain-containing protein [Enterococcus faecalis]|uniref:WxL domain-containing protein n=3 Tax=Enterococcus faecalis TaxID=1351 RepID=UPI003B677641